MAAPASLDDLNVKRALYHHERGRVYRPTSLEIQTNKFSCPRCRTQLIEVRVRASEKALSCPSCRWSIHRDDIWSPAPEQEPAVREPGDATENTENPNPLADLNVADTVPVQTPTEILL